MPNVKLTDQQHEDLIITALEGGSNYWYFISDIAMNIITKTTPYYRGCFSERFWEAIRYKGAVIPINDIENQLTKIGEISLASI